MTIRLAKNGENTAVQQLLTTIFDDDPLMEWFIRKDDKRSQAYPLFFDYLINRYCLPYGECWVNEQLSGAALWMPPGKWELPWRVQLATLGQVLSIFGLPHLFQKFNDRRIIDQAHPRHPHYYLAALGVASSERQKGLGSRLLQPVLKRCDKEGTGCYLETSRERNIRFYERHGFIIMKKISFSPARHPLWCMWRTPITQRQRKSPPQVNS